MKTLTDLYQAHDFPVFQNRMFDSPESAKNCQKGNITISQDCETGLIFNRQFNPELLVYDENYQNEQAVSACFQSHLDDVIKVIRRHFHSNDVIEIGCGKGYFMTKLREAGYQVTGLDPTYQGEDASVVKKFYGPELGLFANGLVLRHVLEHIQDPYTFLKLIRDSNAGRGLLYIEVPCFDWICAKHAWFDIFYEHVNYFRLPDFARLFGTVLEAGHTFGGQYLYAIVDLRTLRSPKSDEPAFVFPPDFSKAIDSFKRVYLEKRRPLVVWGAASKGVIFSLLMQRAGVEIDAIVDINPAKQGLYIPATGIRVSSVEEVMNKYDRNTDVLVMNSNYLEEVRKITKNSFNYMVPDEFSV
jgi:SAM-dependent methyltransferase